MNEMKRCIKLFVLVLLFSVAMAVVESAVVVYLRTLYYQEGFTVAMKIVNTTIIKVELAREVATIVMLFVVGYLAGRDTRERFAYFLFSFAVWDIFYYIWLKVFIDWPHSILAWDILFLLPVTWLAPVLAPVLCSVTMIIFSIVLLRRGQMKDYLVPPASIMAAGCALILFTFLVDYGKIMVSSGLWKSYTSILENKDFLIHARNYIPESYRWDMFIAGEVLLYAGIVLIAIRKRPTQIVLTAATRKVD